jgi:hypothetical protein
MFVLVLILDMIRMRVQLPPSPQTKTMKFEKNKKFNKENGTESLPEKEKRLVKEIEKLPITVIEKINFMLVWRALKPSAKLTYVLKTWGAGDPEPDLTPERKHARILKFNQLLGFLGLSAVVGREIRKEPSFEEDLEIPGIESRKIYIAHGIEIAEKLAEQIQEENNEETLEINESHKTEIQRLSPILYTKMIKELESK